MTEAPLGKSVPVSQRPLAADLAVGVFYMLGGSTLRTGLEMGKVLGEGLATAARRLTANRQPSGPARRG